MEMVVSECVCVCVWNKCVGEYEQGISVVRKCLMSKRAWGGLNWMTWNEKKNKKVPCHAHDP